jgi:hypothetical protein
VVMVVIVVVAVIVVVMGVPARAVTMPTEP